MNNKQTVTKHKIFFNYEKEETWVNEMAQEGYNLIEFSIGKYTFEQGIPGEYLYRYQYLAGQTEEGIQEHINLFKKTGAEIVINNSNWIIIRKKRSEGPFELFADYESEIRHYQSIMRILNVIAIGGIVLGISNISIASQINRTIAIVCFSVAALLFVVIGSYSTQIRKLTEENKKK